MTPSAPSGRSGKASPSGRPAAVAIDLGTTTIAAASIDLSEARRGLLAASSRPNPQRRWGADVITRLNALAGDPPLLAEMRSAVLKACDELIEEVLPGGDAKAVAVAGNTVMEHILLGVSPAPLARVPYRPVFTEARETTGMEAGLKSAPEALFYSFPMIGGYVGGDAVAAALSLSTGGREAVEGGPGRGAAVLALDIGTNSEILLWANGSLYSTSAAAGPAFEAGGVRCGMTAERGAIRSVRIVSGQVRLDVVGGVMARGICGSGLIDAAAALIRAGAIDRSGRIVGRSEAPDSLSDRIREGAGANSFILFRGAQGSVALEQEDVRSLQTAKAAIRAGITVLLKKAGVAKEAVGAVYLCGAFGSNLDAESVAEIGLIDRGWLGRTSFAGDAALDGALLAAVSEEKRREAEALAASAKYVPLSGSAGFEREFIKNMDF